MITPTSTLSKNYQALGIDEIANDIETVFNAVNDITPTTTVVNISSAQILAMGSSPIVLLPTPGAGLYYDIEKIILEYTHVTTPYTFSSEIIVQDSIGYWIQYLYDFTAESANTVVTLDFKNVIFNVGLSPADFTLGYSKLNQGFIFKSNTNPTLGDGTLRAIITYTTRTFGA